MTLTPAFSIDIKSDVNYDIFLKGETLEFVEWRTDKERSVPVKKDGDGFVCADDDSRAYIGLVRRSSATGTLMSWFAQQKYSRPPECEYLALDKPSQILA